MANKVPTSLAVVGAVVAAVVVLGGVVMFAGAKTEARPSDHTDSQVAAPASTTRLSWADQEPNPSGTEPTPDDDRYPPVPSEQVDGDLTPMARTAGRNLYIPVQDDDCSRTQVWPRGEHADRVDVEIRPLPTTPPPGVTLDTNANANGNGSYGCIGRVDRNGPYAVIELAEPLATGGSW